tara:strand:- start:4939 stop:5520 length:582 start_codon:yes stop_codon:yes gene_type:complete
MANEKITHIENFLPTDIQDNIENLMADSSVFSWFLFPRTAVDFVDSDNVIETSQLVHQFLKDGEQNSDYLKDTFSVAEYLQKKINIKIDDWDRIKGNCLFPYHNYTKDNHHPIHQDISKEDNYYTFLYYVNDSDGDTRFFDENNLEESIFKCTPKKGTGVLFPSKTWHSSSNPMHSDYRMVINYVFKSEEILT